MKGQESCPWLKMTHSWQSLFLTSTDLNGKINTVPKMGHFFFFLLLSSYFTRRGQRYRPPPESDRLAGERRALPGLPWEGQSSQRRPWGSGVAGFVLKAKPFPSASGPVSCSRFEWLFLWDYHCFVSSCFNVFWVTELQVSVPGLRAHKAVEATYCPPRLWNRKNPWVSNVP